MSVTAIYTGTFDPLTNGHADLVARAAGLFDHVVVAIGINPNKKTMFTLEERIDLAASVLARHPNVSVESYAGLTVNYARERGAKVILRGVRTAVDFEYEMQMDHMNHEMAPEVETVYLAPSLEFGHVSSTLVRDIATHRGDVSAWVDPLVRDALVAKLGH